MMEARISQSRSFITNVRQSKLTNQEKKLQINEFRESNKISSMALIFSATTSMVGAGILVYPLLYKDNGIILSQIIVTLVGAISYKTAQLCISHCKDNEHDLSQVILRQLGRKWQTVYCATGCIYLFLTACIYYTLILNTFYSQLNFINNLINGSFFISKDIRTFSVFSFSWTNFIIAAFFALIVNLKSLKLIMKLGEYSFAGICVFTIYCISKSFINIDYLISQQDNPNFHQEPILLFSSQFAVLAGSCAVAFNVHNMIVPIVQQSTNKANNQRDLKIIYIITYICYTLMGCMGYVAILNVKSKVTIPNTFMDYVPEDEISGFIVDVFLLFKLSCISPLYVYLGKNQLFDLIYPDRQVPWQATQMVNCSFLVIVMVIGYFNVAPTTIYAINGSYCGIVLIYAVPIAIHLTCLYKTPCKSNFKQSKMISKVSQIVSHGQTESNDVMEDHMLMDGGQNKTSLLTKEVKHFNSYCQTQNYKNTKKSTRYVIYGFFMLFGIVNSVLVVFNLATQ